MSQHLEVKTGESLAASGTGCEVQSRKKAELGIGCGLLASCVTATAAVVTSRAAAKAPEALTVLEGATGRALVTTTAEWLQPASSKDMRMTRTGASYRKGVRAIFL